jgi:hypothetical protein
MRLDKYLRSDISKGGETLNVNTHIPVMFQKIKSFESEDTRFLKVKIWLMHIGENLNGSYFSKEVVEEAIDSLKNTPILAYIEDNSNDEKDFSDHRMVLVKEDGQFKIKYIGQAIGTIPESNNAQFEMRLCDDGIEREFLTVEGLVWQKWDDPIDIFSRDIIKNQSMELHDDYKGEWKKDKLFHFTSFKFFGACALSSDVLPAMQNATIEAQFSYDKMFEEIQGKIEEFKQFSLQNQTPITKEIDINALQEGGNKVDEILKMLEQYSLTLDDLKEKEIDHEQFSLEELENKVKETFKSKEDIQTDFALTYGQLRDEIRAELYKEKTADSWGYHYSRYWFVDFDDEKVVAEDGEDSYRLVGFKYSKDGDKVTIDFNSKDRVTVSYPWSESANDSLFEIASKERLEYELKVKDKELEQTFSEQKQNEIKQISDELTVLKEQFSTLENETKELREFKVNKTQQERKESENELFAQFATQLSDEEIAPIKEAASGMELDVIEKELFALVGKKQAKFSVVKKENKSIKIGIDSRLEEVKDEKPYAHLFQKYAQ